MRRRAARRVGGAVVGWVVRGGIVVVVVVVVANGEEEEGGRDEGLVGRDGGVEVVEEEDMSVLEEWEREREGSVVSGRCRLARREVRNAGDVSFVADIEIEGGRV